jgi:toxin CcdB
MARFDVYEVDGPVPFVIDVQADLVAELHTRVVVPLLPATKSPTESMPRLRPRVSVLSQE